MKRSYLMAMLLATALSTGPAVAATVKEKLVNELKSQGFVDLTITRTWLGRTRIIGSNGKYKRELVFNPYSGEILRDYWEEVKSTEDKPKSDAKEKDAKKSEARLLDPDDAETGNPTSSDGHDDSEGGGDNNDGGDSGGDNGHSDNGGGSDGHDG